jgi:hypothetical protein
MPKRVQELTWSRPAAPKALYYEQRFGWIEGVNLDPRLANETRRVLTVLALEFRNKKTGECFPSVRRLAMWCGLGESESAIRAARRAVEEGEKLGWIRRHPRFGGDSKHNQSNSYEFLVPEDVTPAGLAANVKLQVAERDGRWFVTQVKDGMEICGPFRTQKATETWMREHGLPASRPDKSEARPDKIGVPTGQNRGPDRTPVSGNNLRVEHGKSNKRDLEHSVLTYCRSDERHRPVDSKTAGQRHPTGCIKNPSGSNPASSNPASSNPAGSIKNPAGGESLSAGSGRISAGSKRDLPGYGNRYTPRREDEIADCIRRLEGGKDVSEVAFDILEEARRRLPDDDDMPF